MRSIYGILFGTLFIVFIQASFLDQAISFPADPQALFNAGTELYLQNDFSKATIFLERAKKCCSQKKEKDLKVKELAENISLNLAHSLVKAEKYQEALAEYKDLYCKFKNPKAEKNIPILEKFLQQEDQQDKQQKNEQDTEDQDSKDQDAGSGQSQDNANENSDSKSDQVKDDFDKKNNQKKKQKLEKEQDQKEKKIEQEQQENKQKENGPDRNKNQAHAANPPNDLINSKNKNQNKQKITNQQILDQDEQDLLKAIENFDQDMMKMYAAANCGGDEDDGW